jgi:hypothetical protein
VATIRPERDGGDGDDVIVRTHRAVRAFLAAIEASVPGDAQAPWRSSLEVLRPLLPDHFAAEERPDGFCDRVARYVGAERAAALRRDHRELLRWVDALGVVAGRRLELAARAFAARLSDHERSESELALRCERIAGR